jgi:hypothetical protein
MRLIYRATLITLSMAASAFTQHQWEAGALGGYSITRNVSISNSSRSSVSTGFENGPVWGFVAGSNDYRFLGGEASYLYSGSGIKVDGAGQKVRFGAETHFVDFRLLLHFADRDARLRPFLAIGGGVAVYTGTGAESSTQPLNNFVALTHTRETKPMLSAAAGVKFRITPHICLRFEFRDYVTPFPDQVIAPVPGASAGGWLHHLTPVGGIVGVF